MAEGAVFGLNTRNGLAQDAGLAKVVCVVQRAPSVPVMKPAYLVRKRDRARLGDSALGSDPWPLPPAGNTRRDSLIAQFVADHFQPVIRASPFQVAELLLKWNVGAKGGQLPVKHSLFTSVR